MPVVLRFSVLQGRTVEADSRIEGVEMNEDLFNEMIAGFTEAKKYRTGRKAKLRVSRLAFEPVHMKPTQIE
jgi:hypothetical protein